MIELFRALLSIVSAITAVTCLITCNVQIAIFWILVAIWLGDCS